MTPQKDSADGTATPKSPPAPAALADMTPQEDPAEGTAEIEQLLVEVRRGQEAINELFGRIRPQLRERAACRAGRRLGAKEDASDVVQQAIDKGVAAFPKFKGTTELAWLDWMRTIVDHTLQDLVRRYRWKQRDLNREQPLLTGTESSSCEEMLPDKKVSTPSAVAIQREEAERVRKEKKRMWKAIDELSDKQRLAVVLRGKLGLSFKKVGLALYRCKEVKDRAASAEQLYRRTVLALRAKLKEDGRAN